MLLRPVSVIALITSWLQVYSTPDLEQPRTLEVPWKYRRRGVYDLRQRRQNVSYGCINGPQSRSCWDSDHNIDTRTDDQWPDTGYVVKYEWEITNTTMAPDGFARQVMVVNGQYPGPAIVAEWGDTIEVTVTNRLTMNGTGIHWHGIRQLGTNDMDGTPGITECPIPPGGKKVYTFKATQYGTSWYHSHYSVQYSDGVLGPIIIHGPSTANYDIDLGALPITDWFHTPVFTLNAVALHGTAPPTADNMLVNGSMTSAYGGRYAVTRLTPGKTHLLRLINTGNNNWVHVALDKHVFTVIAADFVPIVPYTTNSLSIAVGQRYDILIHANQTTANYWLRVGTGGGTCDGSNLNAANIRSIFRYDGAYLEDPYSTPDAPLPQGCYDEPNIVPWVPTQVPDEIPQEISLNFTNNGINGTQPTLIQWLINETPLRVNLSLPTLMQMAENATFDRFENVFEIGGDGAWQFFLIQQLPAIPAQLPHPIHLHGHDFYVLAAAENATYPSNLNLALANPTRRDTATLPARGYLVLAFKADNPGAWLMHCHVAWHVSAGFGLQFVERWSEIPGTGDLPAACAAWESWQNAVYPGGFEEGDSGV